MLTVRRASFKVEKASGHRYEVNFGKDTTEEMPSFMHM